MSENLTFYKPTEEQLAKFRRINRTPEWINDMACIECGDCSKCLAAVHQHLISTTKHTCTYGITEEKFRILMSDADCEY